MQIRTVLLSIQALLSAPNPDDPLANDVAEQWKTNESRAIETGAPVIAIVDRFIDKVMLILWMILLSQLSLSSSPVDQTVCDEPLRTVAMSLLVIVVCFF